ncbi:MAG: hypothetical protein ACLR67_06660, partial [Eggerthella lenta]
KELSMNMIKKNTASRLDKVRALLVVGEEDGGSEIVQTVIVLGFAVGLGAALLLLQGNIQTAITKAGTSVTDMFSKITSGAA